ncbi:MAG: alpha/beta hydrolase [Myxococcota bacterium]
MIRRSRRVGGHRARVATFRPRRRIEESAMSETIAQGVGPAGMRVAYERMGDPDAPMVLLVMGIAAQLVHWPDGFCAALVARGLQVVRFDNRDSGRSSHFPDGPVPNLPAVMAGDLSSVSYTLSDMAADAAGLLDALGVDSAHVVGASLGGAIAQTMAIEHPSRVRSLTSMMSTTGDTAVGKAKPETLSALFGGPPATTRVEVVARAVRAAEVVGSPGFPRDPSVVADTAGRAFDRDYDVVAVARQAVASVASGDRTPALRRLDVPTLIVHGLADTLCDPSGGRATAAAIPAAELALVDGMGHDLAPGLWPRLVDAIGAVVERGERRRRERGARG